MSVIIADNSFHSKWNNYLNKKGGMIYLRWEWREIVRKNLGYNPVFFVSKKNNVVNGILPLYQKNGIMQKILRILPCTGYIDIPVDSEVILEELVKAAFIYCQKKGINLEISSLVYPKKKIKNLKVYKSFLSDYFLDINRSYEKIYYTFAKRNRDYVRKIEKIKVPISMCSKNDLINFYNIYLLTMKDLGSLPIPFSFFESVFSAFDGNLYKSKTDAESFVWCFTSKNCLYIWRVGHRRGTSTNKLSYDALINYLIKNAVNKSNKVKIIDYGSSATDGGVAILKKRWGFSARDVYTISNKKDVSRFNLVAKLKIRMIRIMPRSFIYWLGQKSVFY